MPLKVALRVFSFVPLPESAVMQHRDNGRNLAQGASALFAFMLPALSLAQVPLRFESSATMSLRLDSLEAHLHSPVGMVQTSRRGVALVDAHGGAIVFVDRNGRSGSHLGRIGDGPGEFRHIGSMARCRPATFFVFDQMHARISIVSNLGRILREFPLTMAGRPITPLAVACSNEGVLAALLRPRRLTPGREDSPVVGGEGKLVLIDSTGVVLRALAEVSGGEFVVLDGGGAPRPLGRVTHFAIGRAFVAIATNESSSIDLLSLREGTRLTVNLKIEREATSQREYEAAIESLLSMVPAGLTPNLRDRFRAIPRPEHHPFFDSIHIDDCDRLWLSSRGMRGAATILTVLTPKGDLLAKGEIARALRVMDVNSDYVLGINNAEGAERIELHRLIGGLDLCP